MNKLIATIALVICTCTASLNVNAQKIGHLDVDSLMKIWPAYQQVIDTLANTRIQLQKTAEQLLLQIYKQEAIIDSMKDKDSPLIASLRVTELTQMKSNYEQFISLASGQIEAMQAELSDTLYKQLNAAIARVAKTKGFTYILDSSRGGQVMFADPANDVFDLVRQELKIPLPVKKTVQEPVVPVMGGR